MLKGGDNAAALQAGLPNITGKAWSFCGTAGSGLDGADGAFFLSHQGTSDVAGGQTGSASAYDAININAAACNSIYGNSDTVQVAAFAFMPQVRI